MRDVVEEEDIYSSGGDYRALQLQGICLRRCIGRTVRCYRLSRCKGGESPSRLARVQLGGIGTVGYGSCATVSTPGVEI